jgi:putative membrane protein
MREPRPFISSTLIRRLRPKCAAPVSNAKRFPMPPQQALLAKLVHGEWSMLTRFIVRVIFGALGLWVAKEMVAGIYVHDATALLLAALLLGVVNAFVRPVVVVLTLPLTIVTLGLFLLIVNAGMIWLVSLVVPGFAVHGLIAGVLAAIITGIASWIGGMILRDDRRERRR